MSANEDWHLIEGIEVPLGPRIGFIGDIEAKGVSRRMTAAVVDAPGQSREVIARWRDGVPASVRVLASQRFSSEQRTAIERELIAYLRGLRETRPSIARAWIIEPEDYLPGLGDQQQINGQ